MFSFLVLFDNISQCLSFLMIPYMGLLKEALLLHEKEGNYRVVTVIKSVKEKKIRGRNS